MCTVNLVLFPTTAEIISYHVVVTEHPTRETIRTLVTSNNFATINSLSCCQEYDSMVFASIDGVYGDPATLSSGFRTKPDLSSKLVHVINKLPLHVRLWQIMTEFNTDPPNVSVSIMENLLSINISWVKSTVTATQHLPTDSYTVTVTPDCKYHQHTGMAIPPPQTVPYNATLVEIAQLGMS